MLDKLRNNAQSWAIKGLFAIIILAFIISFAMPKGSNKNAVVHVYDQTITIDQFLRNLPNEAADDPRARQYVLQSMVNTLLMEHKADQLGFEPADKEVARAIATMPEFQTEGRFDMDRYKRALRDPKGFEANQKSNLAVQNLQRLAIATAIPSEAEARGLFEWRNEQTTIDYLVISSADFMSIVSVPEEEIQAKYEESKDSYAEPARIEMLYLRFTPKALAVTQEVTDEEVEKYYNEMAAILNTGKQVTFLQILVPVAEDGSTSEVEAAREEAGLLAEQIASGADMAGLARKYADKAGDPALAEERTMSPDLLPDALAQALSQMSPGQVSEPVRTHLGFNLVQLVGVEESRPLTLEEARDDIRVTLAQDKAALAIDDMVDQTIAQLGQGKSLGEIAESLGLPTEESGPVTATQLQEDFGLSEGASETLFSLVPGTTTRTPLLLDGGGYLLAEKIDDIPSEPRALDEVHDEIRDELAKGRAEDLALKEAQEVLGAIQNPEVDPDQALSLYAHLIRTSEPFSRSGGIPGLNADPALVAEAFRSQPGRWLTQAFASEHGILLAKVNDRIPASDALWEEQKVAWINAVGQANAQEVLQAMSASLFQQAQDAQALDLVRPDIIEQN